VQTPSFGYNGIAPGPTILARRGTPLTVNVRNELPAKHPNWGYEARTSTHLHGSASKPQYNGYASDITRVGQAKTYQFDPQRLPVPRPAPAAEQHQPPDDGHRHRRRAPATSTTPTRSCSSR
jgi:FtsP/CotA-like multicopper oxidase with cupredoxin domain